MLPPTHCHFLEPENWQKSALINTSDRREKWHHWDVTEKDNKYMMVNCTATGLPDNHYKYPKQWYELDYFKFILNFEPAQMYQLLTKSDINYLSSALNNFKNKLCQFTDAI